MISIYRNIYSLNKIIRQKDKICFAWNSLIIDKMPVSGYQIWSAVADNLKHLLPKQP